MGKIYTIGFTGKSAHEFFDLLNSTDAKYLADTRLNNNSQLTGFTKKGSIEYFVENLTRLEYIELPLLAPEKEMFQEYRKDADWELYESRYISLLEERSAAKAIDRSLLDGGVTILDLNVDTRYDRRTVLRMDFRDASGEVHTRFPVNDLAFRGMFSQLMECHGRTPQASDSLMSKLRRSDRTYLRIGLARPTSIGRHPETCWVQVTGVYTFPDYLDDRNWSAFK